MKSFSLHAARPGDVADVFALVRALAEYEKLTNLVSGTEQELRDELFGPRPVIECVVAREGIDGAADAAQPGRALGFALYFHNYSTFLARRGLYLEDLFVVPDARGRGVGKALIAHVARIAVERRCGRFEWTVLDWNRPAIDFYQSLGATLLMDWRICRLTGASLQALAQRAADAPRLAPSTAQAAT